MKIPITKSSSPKEKIKDESKLGFGTYFTDHMFTMDYHPEKGWHDPQIQPYAPFPVDPAFMVFHYGQAIFEGLKAFRNETGEVVLFRPKENIKRLNRSAKRICIPKFDEDLVMKALKKLISLEREWVPQSMGTSLYIRPFIFATDPFLGVRASETYRFFIILSPVGAYYAAGFKPIKIKVSTKYVRAVRGGVGEAKTAGNYAASLLASEEAAGEGFSQVLWLDGIERKYVEEVGAMNIFFVVGEDIVTPGLTGSLLPGITRQSLIELAPSLGYRVSEQRISMEEIRGAYQTGKLREVFGSGTAAVISPVGTIKFGDLVMKIGDGRVGPVARTLYKALTDIQYGRTDGPDGWVETL